MRVFGTDPMSDTPHFRRPSIMRRDRSSGRCLLYWEGTRTDQEGFPCESVHLRWPQCLRSCPSGALMPPRTRLTLHRWRQAKQKLRTLMFPTSAANAWAKEMIARVADFSLLTFTI